MDTGVRTTGSQEGRAQGAGARWGAARGGIADSYMASLTAGGRTLAAARGHDERTWTQRAGPGFLSRYTPRHIRPHLPEIQHIVVQSKQRWGLGLQEAARPGRVRVSNPPAERQDARHCPWRAGPCGRDEGRAPHPMPSCQGQWGSGSPPGPADGEGIRGERGRGGMSPLIVLLCFPRSGPWRSLAAGPSRAAGQGRGKDRRTDNERT